MRKYSFRTFGITRTSLGLVGLLLFLPWSLGPGSKDVQSQDENQRRGLPYVKQVDVDTLPKYNEVRVWREENE